MATLRHQVWIDAPVAKVCRTRASNGRSPARIRGAYCVRDREARESRERRQRILRLLQLRLGATPM